MRRRCAGGCGRSLPGWSDDYCGTCDDRRLLLAAKREKKIPSLFREGERSTPDLRLVRLTSGPRQDRQQPDDLFTV